MIKYPIFIVDKRGIDIRVYASVEDAQSHLESIDVENDEYKGYDAEGRLLQIGTENDKVVISLTGNAPFRAQELEEALRAYLKAIGEPVRNDHLYNLQCLVEVYHKFLYTPRTTKGIILDLCRKFSRVLCTAFRFK